jgi:hypothetical protein
LLEASLLLCSRDERSLEAAGWIYAEIASLQKNLRQEKHAAAIRAAIDGDRAAARRLHEILARELLEKGRLNAGGL